MRLLRRLLATSISSMLLLPAGPIGAAGDKDTSTTPAATAAVYNDSILAEVEIGRPPASATSADSHGCVWYPGVGVGSTTAGAAMSTKDSKVINGVTYHIFIKVCTGGGDSGIVWVPQLSAKALAQAATSRVEQLLPHPTLHTAPNTTHGIVNLAMWYWTNPDQYTPITATAWIPTPTGITTATTTATPTTLTYTPGEPDSQPTSCTGPGQPWTLNRPEFGDCSGYWVAASKACRF